MKPKLSYRCKDWFFRAIRPSCWYNSRGLEITKETDDFINKLIDLDCLKSIGTHTVVFDYKGTLVEVWTSNFPYGYGNIYRVNDRPFTIKGFEQGTTFITRYRLFNYLKQKEIETCSKNFKEFFSLMKESTKNDQCKTGVY